jgi:rRNA maturation RNase YbeY
MDSSHSHRIDVVNETKQRVRVTPLKHALAVTLTHHRRENAEVYVLLTDDERMCRLNSQFRGIEQSTDVLSFPGGEFPNSPLGDIAISIPYARKQADEHGAALETELGYLAIHGCLHLLGFDDETFDDRARMIAEMLEIAEKVGLPEDPYWQTTLGSST